MTTSFSAKTVYTTFVSTITSCAATVTNCPAKSTVLATVSSAVSTTMVAVQTSTLSSGEVNSTADMPTGTTLDDLLSWVASFFSAHGGADYTGDTVV